MILTNTGSVIADISVARTAAFVAETIALGTLIGRRVGAKRDRAVQTAELIRSTSRVHLTVGVTLGAMTPDAERPRRMTHVTAVRCLFTVETG